MPTQYYVTMDYELKRSSNTFVFLTKQTGSGLKAGRQTVIE